MATLETSYGWVQGDQVRLLIAAGLSIGSYQIEQITLDMNELGTISTDAVTNVRGLIDDYEAAQLRFKTLNAGAISAKLVIAPLPLVLIQVLCPTRKSPGASLQ